MKLPKEVEMRFVLMRLDLDKGMRYKQKFGDWPEGFAELIEDFDTYLKGMIPFIVDEQESESEKSEAVDDMLNILDKINNAIRPDDTI